MFIVGVRYHCQKKFKRRIVISAILTMLLTKRIIICSIPQLQFINVSSQLLLNAVEIQLCGLLF